MILLLSGPAAAGKSTICKRLAEKHDFAPIKSSSYLRRLIEPQEREVTREILQEIGDRLDVETDFNWIVDDVALPQMAANQDQQFWFVDSVRKAEQIDRFLIAFPEQVLHCHVTAPDEVLKSRLQNRSAAEGNHSYEKTFAEHNAHPNEVSARSLGGFAELVVDTSKDDPRSAIDAIMERVRGKCQEK
tara:strand:+ start:24 stop:587 length:564 start_codon:yes stop_codon:yes gene_type:complete